MILIESNFGDGMFRELLTPYMVKTHPVTMEEVRHNTQKEKRIIDTLEPVMNQHRLIVDPTVIEDDYKSAQVYPADKATRYMLFYQMTRLTRDRGALSHDDRLDALSMAVAYWVQQMAADAEKQIIDRKGELLNAELDKFMENCFHVKHGGYQQQDTWLSSTMRHL